MNKLLLLFLNIILIIVVSSCKVTDSNHCNLDEYKNIEIELGYFTSQHHRDYFKLQNNLLIHNGTQDTIKLENSIACNLFEKTTQLFFKTQALNVPADSNHYFIYRNKVEGTELRTLWNPEHTNQGNKEFKSLYQDYMDIIYRKESLK
ncbi:MAG TPA: hypothetical protein PLE30_06565 [Candidatus Kapabacteria bacterium]|nr:hypothetical protein [Candidatus Kapabacteria bacterium]